MTRTNFQVTRMLPGIDLGARWSNGSMLALLEGIIVLLRESDLLSFHLRGVSEETRWLLSRLSVPDVFLECLAAVLGQ